jgi:alkanesulfonate monooxygenase SsuD/methylene tetrahydromethanopterin reductase-like flavin-dependent oxidoreductase (luciferase family)
LKERVQAMKVIWTQDEAGFDGEFVHFEPIWSWPKPVQRPHPPVILGAHGPKALARVVDYCDGWIPIGVRSGDLQKEVAALRRLAREKGRDPETISVTVYGAPGDREVLAPLRDAGVTRAVFSLPPAGPEKVLPLLDRYAEVARSLTA